MKQKKKKEKTLKPSLPNAGIQLWYQRELRRQITRMHKNVTAKILTSFSKNSLAYDASPASMIRNTLRALSARWVKKFTALSDDLAKTFVNRAAGNVDVPLKKQLVDKGFAIDFKMTRDMHNAVTAIVAENVSLIKSIPQRYFTNVESVVLQSVSRGGDLAQLKKTLGQQFGVTARRAELIARDQNRKANSALAAVRQHALGITEGIWRHTGAGQHPRPDHVKATGKKFSLRKGCLISGEYILPGEKINCGCIWEPVLPTFED